MIDEVLALLKDKLNNYFKLKTGAAEDVVNFIDGNQLDPISFPVNNIVPLLINIEEDKTLRQADRFEGKISNGIKTQINPAICINLLVLFVCRFTDYKQSLRFLSLVIRFFQRNSILDHFNTPDLHEDISKLRIDLVTLPVAAQNEIWSSLRTSYVPSVLYKIGMLVFEDDESFKAVHEVLDIQINVLNS